MSRVGVLDYGVGNIENVVRALRAIGAEVTVIDEPEKLADFPRLVVPGVGRFDFGMQQLETIGFAVSLREAAQRGTSILGICLGMQLFATSSSEGGETRGLGLFGGDVRNMSQSNASDFGERLPHTGWSPVFWAASGDDERFRVLRDAYFSHSFHLVPDSTTEVLATVDLGNKSFVALARKGTVLGAQFHPEKSGLGGLRFLDKWMG